MVDGDLINITFSIDLWGNQCIIVIYSQAQIW